MMLASFSTILISALAVSATPKLSLTIGGAEKSADSPALKVIATLTNTGNETLQLLNDPRGILSTIPTNTFRISSANGGDPTFNGLRLKYVPRYVIGKGEADSFTVLKPGESTKVPHDLFDAYDFTAAGAGQYHVNAQNLFLYVDPATNTSTRIFADTGEGHKLQVTKKKLSIHRKRVRTRLSGSSRSQKFGKRAQFRKCTNEQIQAILPATTNARQYANATLSYLIANKKATDRYTTWWGAFTDKRYAKVLQQYTNLAANDYPNFDYDCSCSEKDTFAFVYPDEFGVINLCPAFWTAPLEGTDSRTGTLIHESSHFTANAGTEDNAYGQDACKKLAKKDPDTAIMNADSHEYFSENNPEQQKNATSKAH